MPLFMPSRFSPLSVCLSVHNVFSPVQILVNNFTYSAIANAAHSAVKKYDADTLSLDIKVNQHFSIPITILPGKGRLEAGAS